MFCSSAWLPRPSPMWEFSFFSSPSWFTELVALLSLPQFEWWGLSFRICWCDVIKHTICALTPAPPPPPPLPPPATNTPTPPSLHRLALYFANIAEAWRHTRQQTFQSQSQQMCHHKKLYGIFEKKPWVPNQADLELLRAFGNWSRASGNHDVMIVGILWSRGVKLPFNCNDGLTQFAITDACKAAWAWHSVIFLVRRPPLRLFLHFYSLSNANSIWKESRRACICVHTVKVVLV